LLFGRGQLERDFINLKGISNVSQGDLEVHCGDVRVVRPSDSLNSPELHAVSKRTGTVSVFQSNQPGVRVQAGTMQTAGDSDGLATWPQKWTPGICGGMHATPRKGDVAFGLTWRAARCTARRCLEQG
jgi:hypothetical protein